MSNDAQAYRPAPAVLERLRKVTLVAVVGPTAVGKSTLIKAAQAREPRLQYVVGDTSREPRPGEYEGVDYHFKTRDAIEARLATGGYVQVAPSILDELYVTAPEQYTTSGVAVYAIIAQAMPTFRALPFKAIRAIFILPPDYQTWQERLKRHNFSPEQLHRRMVEAERSLVFAREDEATHFVISHNLDIAAEDFIALALGRPLSPRLLGDQSRGRDIAADLLEHVCASL